MFVRNCVFLLSGFIVTSLARGQIPAPPMPVAVDPNAKPAGWTMVSGKVVDENGKPVDQAHVGGSFWSVYGNGSSAGLLDEVKTNQQGEFTVRYWASSHTTLSLRAWKDGSFCAKASEFKGDTIPQPVELAIAVKHARGMTGKVVNDQGHVVASATIELTYVPNILESYETRLGKPIGAGLPKIVTNDEGKFVVPSLLDPVGNYRATASAVGHQSNKSPWIKTANQTVLDMGTITLPKTHLIEGRVTDRQGKPVDGALVVRADSRQRTTTHTDNNGQYKLEAPIYPVAVLVVIKENYRTTGRRCDRIEKMDFQLTRRDEPADQKMAMLAPTLSLEERKRLALKLLEPEWTKAQASDKDEDRYRSLEWRAAVDPAGALEALEKKPIKSDWYDGYIRRAIAKRIAHTSFEDARSVVDSIRDPAFRTTGYIDLHDRLGPDKKAEKISCLDQALLHSKAITQTDHRIIYVGRCARRLIELDETARATALLRDEKATAQDLSPAGFSGYARGSFAENLGLVDLAAAIELLDGLKDPMAYSRHLGNLACQLAARRPDDAEQVFKKLTSNTNPQIRSAHEHGTRLRYQMAKGDLSRARQMTSAVEDPFSRAQSFGAIARAVAKSKPKEAVTALDEALAVLDTCANAGKDQFNNLYHGAAIAALLIPVAEQINPELTAEFFWRAASLGVPPRHSGIEDDDNLMAESIGATAMVLAPYDRELAAAYVEQAAAFHRDKYSRTNYIKAAALVNPHRAIELIEKLSNPAVGNYARQDAAGMFLVSGDRTIRQLHRVLGIWHPEDIDE
jgi:hypothetical protein